MDKIEDKFWRKVYVTHIKAGGYLKDAKKAADAALNDYRQIHK